MEGLSAGSRDRAPPDTLTKSGSCGPLQADGWSAAALTGGPRRFAEAETFYHWQGRSEIAGRSRLADQAGARPQAALDLQRSNGKS